MPINNLTQYKYEMNNLQQKRIPFQALFPITPYKIQHQIAQIITQNLQAIQKATEYQKLLVIQSPTGTGKTYSLLVPIINWLAQNRFSLPSCNGSLSTQVIKSTLPSWLVKAKNGPKVQLAKQHQQKIDQLISISQAKNNIISKRKIILSQKSIKKIDFQMIEVQQNQNDKMKQINQQKKITSSLNAKLFQQEMNVQKKQVPVKLVFVSRTHSQLQQIMDSIKKIFKQGQKEGLQKLLSIQLGSKEHLCINSDIKQANKSSSFSSITERCQYLMNNSSCQYFHQEKIKQFIDTNLSQVKLLSQKSNLCGYYGLRNIQDTGDILCVPYATMLNQSIRTKIGINLHNSIIVFDEGHNLLEYTKNSHSSSINYSDLQALSQRIQEYLQKYKEQLKPVNYSLIIHFNTILRALMTFLKKNYEVFLQQNKANQGNLQNYYVKMSILEALIEIGLKQIRIHKIRQYVNLSGLDRKLSFFQCPTLTDQKKQRQKFKNGIFQHKQTISVTKIQNIIYWVQNLIVTDQDNKIILVKCETDNFNKNQSNKNINLKNMSLKILCLESQQLNKIIQQSRMTIVAGGTMEPLDDFIPIFQKFKHGVYKFDHIITESQCKINIVKRFQNKDIKFNHNNLKNDINFLMKAIKTTINKIVSSSSTKEKQGVVIFIQNYRLVANLKQSLKKQTFFDDMVFDESPKFQQTQQIKQLNKKKQDSIFLFYRKKLEAEGKAILISVMGGKLSEGINFSDHLARKLIVFGLPYPNVKAPQIVQIMAYYDSLNIEKYSGKTYYENLCLKSLNQTIGRAIRHKDDYADIYLIDSRFDQIKDKLSTWMRKKTIVVQNLEKL